MQSHVFLLQFSLLIRQVEWSDFVNFFKANTGNDVYSGDHYSGNDGYSGLNPPDDAILFTVSGITAIADKNFGYFHKNDFSPAS